MAFVSVCLYEAIEEIPDQSQGFPPHELRGSVSPWTCCRASNCLQLKRKMKIECDCSHEDAAMCSVPRDGVVSFHNFTLNKVGTHVLIYHHVEILHEGSEEVQCTTREGSEEVKCTTSVRDNIGFRVRVGKPSSLTIVDNPLSVAMGNNTGDEPAFLKPQPSCAYSDQERNTIIFGDRGRVLGVPCYDNSDSLISSLPPDFLLPLPSPYTAPFRICNCQDTACLRQPNTVAAQRKWGALAFGGNLLSVFDDSGLARFTDVHTKLARSDLRFACRFAIEDEELSQTYAATLDRLVGFQLTDNIAISKPFTVFPGRTVSMKALAGPWGRAGNLCPRCPAGVHLPRVGMKAEVQLMDAGDNDLVRCTDAFRFCAGAPSLLLYVMLYIGSDRASDSPAGNLHGTTDSNARFGKAVFTDMRVRASHGHYHLKFLAQATDFLPPRGLLTSKRLIEVNSLTFTVVNGPPHSIVAVDSPGTGTDNGRFLRQPVVGVVDAGGNLVKTDCYSACPGLAPQCSAESVYTDKVRRNVSACLPRVSAMLLGASSARLLGTSSVGSVQGLAAFTDLAIDSGANLPSTCMCPQLLKCRMCHCDLFNRCPAGECNLPGPFPDYVISMGLEGVPGAATLNLPVRLERRAAVMIITRQPELAVANEPFFWDIEVQATSCDAGSLLKSATDTVSISISDNGNGGVIRPVHIHIQTKRTHTYICVVCVCECVYVCTPHAYIYTHIYTNTYIHKHKHVHICM